jgi:hypothetical protein
MRASHKKRLGRLIATLDAAEEEAVNRRCDLEFQGAMCADIRAAMEWRGIDPASSRVLLDAEAEVAELVDSPEFEAADAAWLEAHQEGELFGDEDPLDWLADELGRLGERYLDGSQPDFRFDELLEVWAWALTQYQLLPAIPDDRYGWSENTS